MDLKFHSLYLEKELCEYLNSVEREKFEAMLLGVAIGDALGHPTEYLKPEIRLERFGKVENYLSLPGKERGIGYPTDDTQMTFHTLEQIILDQSFQPGRLMQRFCNLRIINPGLSVRNACYQAKVSQDWTSSGMPSTGNGAVMRITPLLVPWVRKMNPPQWIDLIRATTLTHHHPIAILASLLAGQILTMFLVGKHLLNECALFELIQSTVLPEEKKTSPTQELIRDFKNRIVSQLETAVSGKWTVLEAAQRWGSGADLKETLPTYLYILLLHSSDPNQAIVEAVNSTVDNDSIGALVASAMGALHGKAAFRRSWIQNLSGAIDGNDDGRLQELLDFK